MNVDGGRTHRVAPLPGRCDDDSEDSEDSEDDGDE
jgi:hypothetical protein